MWLCVCVYYILMMQHRCKRTQFLHYRVVDVSGEILGSNAETFGHACPPKPTLWIFAEIGFDFEIWQLVWTEVIHCCSKLWWTWNISTDVLCLYESLFLFLLSPLLSQTPTSMQSLVTVRRYSSQDSIYFFWKLISSSGLHF